MNKTLDGKTRFDDLLFIAGHLIEVLEQENMALAHNHIDVVRNLLDQKTKLSRAYEIRVLGLSKFPNSLEGISSAEIEELKVLGDRIQELIVINARELKINIDVGLRFMDVLSESVKETIPNAGTYSATGSTGVDVPSRHKKATSLAINQQL